MAGRTLASISNIGDGSPAAMDAPGQQQMTWLAAEKRDGARGVDRGAANLSAGAIDAGRNIHGKDRVFGLPRPFVELKNRGFGGSVEIASKTRAKQRVDGKTSGVEVDLLDGLDIAGPPRCGEPRVATQAIARTEEPKLNGKALFREEPRSDKAIAAIVARAAKDGDLRLRGDKPGAFSCHRGPRLFHQQGARRASRDGQSIGLSHFGIG